MPNKQRRSQGDIKECYESNQFIPSRDMDVDSRVSVEEDLAEESPSKKALQLSRGLMQRKIQIVSMQGLT